MNNIVIYKISKSKGMSSSKSSSILVSKGYIKGTKKEKESRINKEEKNPIVNDEIVSKEK